MGRFHWNHLKLRDKLLLMYILCVFIPIVLTNIVFYNVTTNNIKNQKTHDADIALEKLQGELRAVIDEAAGISYLYYIDPFLNELLDRNYDSQIEYVEAFNNVRSVFNKSEQAYKTTSSTVIYTDNPTVLSSGPIMPLSDTVKESDWYRGFMKTNVSYPLFIQDNDTFSLVQRLNYVKGNGYNNLIKIDLNMTTVKQLFAISGFEGTIYFLNPEGAILYSNDNSLDWRSQASQLTALPKSGHSLFFDKVYTNNNYLNGWSLHGVINEGSFLHDVRKSGSFVIYLALINFVLPSLIIAALSRSIHVRLVKIVKHMKKVKNQHFETIPLDGSRDEIGQLTGEFNRMTERIDNLITDVYLADIQKKDLEIRQRQAQLHALHSQINPHFLFNSLETIRMRSMMKGETETAKTIHYMAKIFRKSISWKRSWVSIREEIELTECFLEIQKYRFGDKLQYQLTIEDAVYDQMIPKMTFLPFVENASIHGIESTPGIGLIQIHIGITGNKLMFRLTDNGIGMSEAKLSELLNYLRMDDSMGDNVGMKNVYTRLKLCYKDSFEFDIHSAEGHGTTVELRLPLDMNGQ
ncbi:two-component system, sensor histidine kinase YesM [Paenibacillus catalpae]|uniref:Two-component system, sensor histidine kinase YesM n=1 Tax=Paenibacillus catalpae TaxID=1045775 RepID=A0A1I2ALC8_9BACL|nr:sensor histidine kinase [Paenibacillus catalpae]SFE44559.1 two-component system, sensor histidine kinase YesM [Paenibacillus catalpae]